MKTEELPEKKKKRKHADQTTHACNDRSPRPPSPPSQTVPTIGRPKRRGRHHHPNPCNGRTPGVRVLVKHQRLEKPYPPPRKEEAG